VEPSIRVAVVEDQPLYRELLVTALEATPGITVTASCGSVADARRLVPAGGADVVLLDVDLPDGNGFGLGLSLRRADPRLGIVLLSAHDMLDLLLELDDELAAGWSYLSKNSATSTESLRSAIESSARGQTVLDPALTAKALPRAGSAVGRLSARQFEVLGLVAGGESNQGVADRLGISPRSVENHLGSIYSALDVPADRNPRVFAVLRFIEETSRGGSW
jgi:DNA-binding NarL/FixJ family response regulator